MESNEFNNRLRGILQSFLNDGFTKSHISAITFGNNRHDQFQEFINGRDIGLKPLNKIFDGLGFKFHIVPVLESETETVENIKHIANDSLETLQWILLDYLENKKNNKNKSGLAIVVDNEINSLK